MKKRLFTIIFSLLICSLVSFGLVACQSSNGGSNSGVGGDGGISDIGGDSSIDEVCSHTYSDWTVKTAATCTQKGEEVRACTQCGDEQSQEIAALGHDMGDFIVEVSATCENAGTVGHYVCKTCEKTFDKDKNEIKNLVIDALGHNPSETWTSDKNSHWHACQNTGCAEKLNEAAHSDRDHYCYHCDYKTSEHDYTLIDYNWVGNDYCEAVRTCEKCSADAEGHEEKAIATVTPSVTQNQTCELSEITDFTATFDVEWAQTQAKEDIETATPKGHSESDEWSYNGINHWKACSNDGCSYIYKEGAHEYHTTYVCTTCGYEPEEWALYYSEDTDSYIIVGYLGDETEVTVPSTYNTEPYGEKSILSISGIAMGDFDERRGAFYKNEQITKVVLSEGITEIAWCAFEDCTSLSSVILPSTLKEIGEMAFEGCSELKNITLPNGLTTIKSSAFSKTGLIEVVIPESVTEIGDAFYDCKTLTKITLPFIGSKNGIGAFSNIFYIGIDNASYVPASLKEVVITQKVSVVSQAFYNCTGIQTITFSAGVTTIGSGAFSGCSGLESVTINEATSIGNSAFQGCKSLQSIVIPEGVTCLSASVFFECNKLNGVTLPSTLTEIESSAFYGCSELSSIDIPESVTAIGAGAFQKTALSAVTIPSGVTEIADFAFAETNLTEVDIPDGVTSIGNSAFSECRSLSNVTLPSKLKSIGAIFDIDSKITKITMPWVVRSLALVFGATSNSSVPASLTEVVLTSGKEIQYAFGDCSKLTKITLPDELETIGKNAFSNCSSLTSITLPASLKSVGDQAFLGLKKSATVNFAGTMAQWCGIIFSGTSSSPVEKTGSLYLKDANGNYQKVTSAVIPEGVTEIYGATFYGNTAITSITLPSGIKKIEKDAFLNCSNLVNVYYNGTVEQWCGIEFENGYSTPMGANNGGKTKNFYINNKKPTEIVIPETITKIGKYQFYEVSTISKVTVPNSVTEIGDCAFSSTGITEIVIPSSVKVIGNSVFKWCSSLTKAEIKGTVESMGTNVFYNARLNSVTLPKGTYSINSDFFAQCSLKELKFCGSETEWAQIEKEDGWNRLFSSLNVEFLNEA